MIEKYINNALHQEVWPVKQTNPATNGVIRMREAVLNWLSGAGPTQVANNVATELAEQPKADLAVHIKVALSKLKAAAMDDSGTAVNYSAIRDNPAYAKYRQTHLAALRQFNPLSLSPTAARAFWINLYNALVIDAVLTLDVKSSVTEGFIGIVTFFRRAAYVVGGHRVSLEDMEHGILRGNKGNPYIPGTHFATSDPRLAWALPGDPRIHFALNCGGRSCPPIRAYTPEQLDAQLDLATQGFLDATVTVEPERNAVVLSQILRWYASDFGGQNGVRQFVARHLPDDERRHLLLESADSHIAYAPYDWHLNHK